MLRIRALNEDSSSDSGDDDTQINTKEALEEKAITCYNDALQLLRESKFKDAELLLLELLDNPFLADVVRPTDIKGLSQPPVLLKYLCLKNLGSVLVKQNELEKALDYYKQALELDDTDVTVWFKVGSVALKVLNYELAAVAFQEGLRCSPNHWPCLDHLVTVLYVLNDYIGCLHYIARGLRADPEFLKGIALRDEIFKEQPSILRDYCLFFHKDKCGKEWLESKLPEDVQSEAKDIVDEALAWRQLRRNAFNERCLQKKPTVYAPVPMNVSSWLALGKSIVSVYQYIANSPDSNITFSSAVCFASKDSTVNSVATKSVVDEKWNTGGDQRAEDCHIDDIKENSSIHAQDEEMSEVSDGEKGMDIEEGGPAEQHGGSGVQAGGARRGPKRRRSPSFVEEWMWAGKRRSARVRSTARRETERDEPSLREALRRLIPSSLALDSNTEEDCQLVKSKHVKENFVHLMDDSMDTMDLYKLFECRDSKSDGEHGKSTNGIVGVGGDGTDCEYFGSQKEKCDVVKFVEECRLEEGILPIVKGFVLKLMRMEKMKWPLSLITLYLETYQLMRRHFPHPDSYNPDEDPLWVFTSAQMSLLYAELFMRRYFEARDARLHMYSSLDPGQVLAEDLAVVAFVSSKDWPEELSQVPDRDDNGIPIEGDNSKETIQTKSVLLDMFLRLHWLDCHIFLNEGDISSALHSLKIVLTNLKSNSDTMEKDGDLEVKLVNSKYNQIISKAVTKKLLLTLERNLSLEKVKDLFEEGQYSDVADILETTFHLFSQHQHSKGGQQPWIPNHLALEEGTIPDRPAQLAMFLDALWQMKEYSRCFMWGEACCNEALNKYINAEDEPEQQKWANTLVKLFAGLESCIGKAGISVLDGLSNNKRARLVQNLTQVVCHQLTSDNVYELPIETITPWIILHHIIEYAETKDRGSRDKEVNTDEEEKKIVPVLEEIPSSILILFTAHVYLGRRSWCCLNEGALLFHILDTVTPKLRSQSLTPFRDYLNQNLEQVLFCLYSHPSKKTKARYLNDHGVPPLPLTWERAKQVFECLKPDALPEFDSYQVGSISVEVELMFRRITSLVPPECDSTQLMEKMTDYINGDRKILPTREGESVPFPKEVSSIYYLLGDYYFKNNEWEKAIKNYLLDVCINPLRVDSWAGMALAKGSQLETKLNSCEVLKSESEFLRNAAAAHRCYRRAVELDYTHSLVWIEYGSFVYMIHSFCSRLLKQETHSLSLEMFEFLEKEKEEMLDQAYKCFTTANQIWYRYGVEHGLQDERWLHHYMLGKIAEKRSENPSIYLEHYCKAAEFLYLGNANYPRKISYNNPPDYSMESLEVHYRIHASILKWLEQHEDKPLPNDLRNVFEKHISNALQSPFATFKTKAASGNTPSTVEDDDNKMDSVVKEDVDPGNVEKVSRKRPASEIACEVDNDLTCGNKTPNIPAEAALMQDVIDVIDSIVGKVVEMDKEVSSRPTEMKKWLSDPADTTADSSPQSEEKGGKPGESESDLEKKSKVEEENDGLAVAKIDSKRRNSQESAASVDVGTGAEDGNDDDDDNDDEEDEEEEDEEEVATETAPVSEGGNNVGSAPISSSASSDSSSTSSTSSSSSSSSSSPSSSASNESSSSSSESESEEGQSSNTDSSKVTTSKKKVSVMAAPECKKSSGEKDGAAALSSVQSDEPKVDEKKKSQQENNGENQLVDYEIGDHFDLIQRCLSALENCVHRFPQHYKSVYRITHFYFRSKKRRDVGHCRHLLLGPANPPLGYDSHFGSASSSYPTTPTGGQSTSSALSSSRQNVPGLFADRKNNNFFNGVWRIPVTEIDRPGSFASHMSRCILLLMEVLRELKDHSMLLELSLQLQRTPESDKKYLRDTEREQLSQEALTLAMQSIRNHLKLFSQANQSQEYESTTFGSLKAVEFLLGVYRSYIRVQKHFPHKESMFSQLLVEVYKTVGNKKLEASSLTAQVDQVVRFCQHEIQMSRAAASAAASAAAATATALSNAASTLTASVSLPSVGAFPMFNMPATHQQAPQQQLIPTPPRKFPPSGAIGKQAANAAGGIGSIPSVRQSSGSRGRPSSSGNWARGGRYSYPHASQTKSKNGGLARGSSASLPSQNLFLPPAMPQTMQSLFSDPNLLTAAVQAHLPSMDSFLDLAQYSGITDHIIRQMASVAAAAAAAVSSSGPSLPTPLPSRGYRGRGRGLSRANSVPSSIGNSPQQNVNLLPPFSSPTSANVQKAIKDRPNISITPIGQSVSPQPTLSYQQPPGSYQQLTPPPSQMKMGPTAGYKPPIHKPLPPVNRPAPSTNRQSSPLGKQVMPMAHLKQLPQPSRPSPNSGRPAHAVNKMTPPLNRSAPANRPNPPSRQMSPLSRTSPLSRSTPPPLNQPVSPISKHSLSSQNKSQSIPLLKQIPPPPLKQIPPPPLKQIPPPPLNQIPPPPLKQIPPPPLKQKPPLIPAKQGTGLVNRQTTTQSRPSSGSPHCSSVSSPIGLTERPHMQQQPPPQLPPPPPLQPMPQQSQLQRKHSISMKDPYKKANIAFRHEGSNLPTMNNPPTLSMPSAPPSLEAGVAATLARLPSTQLEIIPTGTATAGGSTTSNIPSRATSMATSSPLLPSLTLPSSITITAKQSSASAFSRPCIIGKKDVLIPPTEASPRGFDEKGNKEAKPGKGVEVITIE